jgi:succinate dehydrogenase / fumarate reductase flavoprotein subunit
MYHQFKQLAGIDITEEPMEVGPTTHYVMGGVRVDPDSQMSTVPGLFAAGECAAGLHGANRLGGNSLSDLLVFGQRAGRYAAEYARAQTPVEPAQDQVEALAREALAPFERAGDDAEGPYQVQFDLQDMMQAQVGIVRTQKEMQKAIDRFEELHARAGRVGVQGNREYNSGWHTALDLRNLLMVSEAVARSAILRKESRGAHFREDHLEKDAEQGRLNTVIRSGDDGEMQVTQEPIQEIRPDLQQIIEDNK